MMAVHNCTGPRAEMMKSQTAVPVNRRSRELWDVMWAITPEGRGDEHSDVILIGTKSKLDLTSVQAFGLVVTAEPYLVLRSLTTS